MNPHLVYLHAILTRIHFVVTDAKTLCKVKNDTVFRITEQKQETHLLLRNRGQLCISL